MRVAVLGTGYVGLTTAVSLAYLGHEVVGVDVDEAKLAKASSASFLRTLSGRCSARARMFSVVS